MLRFARSRGARFVPALFVAWLSTSILAPSSATADPAGPTIPPAPCNCPSDVSIFPPRRPIAPGTVDLAMGMDLSYGRQMWADGPDDDAFAFRFDAAADVRFRRPVTLRVALDPVGVVHPSYAAAHPIGRLSIVPMFRSAVASIGGGFSGYLARDGSDFGPTVRTGGVSGVLRLELGHRDRHRLVLTGGTGWTKGYLSDLGGSFTAPGFSGDATIQIAIPVRRLDALLLRLSTRWFGAVGSVYGEAGFDFVIGPRRGRPGSPGIVLGYRWLAFWDELQQMTMGLRLGVELGGL